MAGKVNPLICENCGGQYQKYFDETSQEVVWQCEECGHEEF